MYYTFIEIYYDVIIVSDVYSRRSERFYSLVSWLGYTMKSSLQLFKTTEISSWYVEIFEMVS